MRPLVGTSTKMNLTSSEAAAYFTALREHAAGLDGVDLFVLPPFTSIWVARAELAGSGIAWGAQDVHAAEGGAHTGDVSAAMLADLGCRFVACGHSERRRDHGETDDVVAAKVERIVAHGMIPIMCVGEPAAGETAAAAAFVTGQVRAGLARLDPAAIAHVIVAYEPVWAIGIGAVPADPAHVEAVHLAIHAELDCLADRPSVGRVIYGGSVDPASAPGILSRGGVDGVFVGRSALDPANLATIAFLAARMAGDRDAPPSPGRHA